MWWIIAGVVVVGATAWGPIVRAILAQKMVAMFGQKISAIASPAHSAGSGKGWYKTGRRKKKWWSNI